MKKILCCIGFLLAVLPMKAQDLKSCFINMPDSLLPLLTSVNRADFGDFLASNMKAQVKNRFGRNSEMLKMTDDYLKLQLTETCMVEMKLLPVNDSVKVICMSQTFKGPVEDSEIRFFDTAWGELQAAEYLSLPSENQFYVNQEGELQKDSLSVLRKYADMYLVRAELSEVNRTLKFCYTTPEYMEKDNRKHLSAYLKKLPLVYLWTGGRFQLQE